MLLEKLKNLGCMLRCQICGFHFISVTIVKRRLSFPSAAIHIWTYGSFLGLPAPPCAAKTKKVVRRPIKRTKETLTADITQIIRETV